MSKRDHKFSKFDRDPEALEWARGHVQALVDKMHRLQQAAERATPPPRRQWRKIADILQRELIGGEGCVITAFDWRKPDIVKALDEEDE